MTVITQTKRFTIREITTKDAPFVLELLNQASFIENIGDRHVRSVEAAIEFIEQGPLQHYATLGHGMWLIVDSHDTPYGMTGLLQREFFDVPDIGYAVSEAYAGMGIASETGRAVLQWAIQHLNANKILAMTNLYNAGSENVLTKLGFHYLETRKLPGYDDDSKIFQLTLN